MVYDPDGRIVAVNRATQAAGGYDRSDLVGRTYADMVAPEEVATEADNFARLATGELDYHDYHADRRRSDGTSIDTALHRVAIRRLDTSLACVISVGRPVRVSNRIKDLIGAG